MRLKNVENCVLRQTRKEVGERIKERATEGGSQEVLRVTAENKERAEEIALCELNQA